MRTISSAEFRKSYASLDEPVWVTVNGHVVGRWEPLRIAKAEMTADIAAVHFLVGEGQQPKPFTTAQRRAAQKARDQVLARMLKKGD